MTNTSYAFRCALLLSIFHLCTRAEPVESNKVNPFKVYQELLEQQGLAHKVPSTPTGKSSPEVDHTALIESAPSELKILVGAFKRLLNTKQKKKLPQAMLFYGAPGTGKTSTAIAFAQEVGIPYIVIKSGNLGTKFQNSVSENLRAQIEKIESTGLAHVIILDEAHLVFNKHNTNRSDADPVGTLLHAINDAQQHKNIIFIATANDINNLHDALQSRFDKASIQFPLPNDEQRRVAAARLLEKPHDDPLVTLVVSKTKGESYRMVEQLIEKAEIYALNEQRDSITAHDINRAYIQMQERKPSRVLQFIQGTWSHRQEIFMVLSTIAGLGIKIYEFKNGTTQVPTPKSESVAKTVDQPLVSTSQAG